MISNDRALSRRRAMTGAMRLLATAGAAWVAGGIGAALAQAQNKIAQKAAQYRGQPKQGHKCAICAHFTAPNSCQIVAGTISPNGWCRLFSPKVE